MKPILFFMALLSFSTHTFSQENYLIVKIGEQYDRTHKKSFFYIAADPYNDSAAEVYNLVRYNGEAYNNQSGIAFYFERTDSTKTFYNYFRSQTEALKFLVQKHWQLISVISEITSGYEDKMVGGSSVPYTKLSSSPVYYFKKPATD